MNNKQHKSSKKNSKSEGTMPRRPAKNFESQNSSDGYYNLYQTSDITSADLLNGTYMNAYFIRAFFKIYGREVEITVKNGAVYHGVLYSLSPRGDILLQCVHRIRGPGDDETKDIVIPSRDNLEDYLAFSCDDIVEMVSKNVDLDEDHHAAVNGTGTKNAPSFITDSQLGASAQVSFSRGENVVNGINGRGGGPDRELTPWCPEENNNDALDADTLDAGSDGCNGWSPEEMMQVNRDNGVKETGFDEDLYTTHLDKSSEEYRKNFEWADKMAKKIEQSTEYVSRNVETNNGDDDEEAKYSAVMRDNNGTSSSNTSTLTSTPPPSDLGVGGGGGMGGPLQHPMQLSSSPGANSREFTPVYSKRSGHRSSAGKGTISPYQHHNSHNQGQGGSPSSYSAAQNVSSTPTGNNAPGGSRGGAPMRQKHPGGSNTGTPGRYAGGATGGPRQFISSSRAQQKAASNVFDPSSSGAAGPHFNGGGGGVALQNQPPTQVNHNSNISPAQSTSTFAVSGTENTVPPASYEQNNLHQVNSSQQQQQQQANGHVPSYSSAISRGSMGHQQGGTPLNTSQANKIGKFKNFSANVTISTRGPSPGQNYPPDTSPKHTAGGAAVKTPSMTPTKGNAWERPPIINSTSKGENEQVVPASAPTSQTPYQGYKQQTPQLMSQNSLPSPSKNSTPISVKKDTSEGSLAETSVASSSSGGGGGSDDLKSSEKSSSDVTSSAEKSVSNSSSSVAVASSAEEVVESDLVKNSKLNVNAQAFKPSGNYFTPAAQTQEPPADEQQSNSAYYQSSPATSDVTPLAAQVTQMSLPDDQASMAAAAAAAQFHQGIPPAAAAPTNFAVPFHHYFTQTAFPNGAAPAMFHQPIPGQIPMSIHSLPGVSAGAAPHLSAGVPAFAPQRPPLLHGAAQNMQVQFPTGPNLLQQTAAGPNGSFNGTSSPTYPSVRGNRPRAPLRGPHPSPQQYLNPSMPNVAATASALGVPQSAAPPNTAGTVAVTGAQIPYQHPALAAAASNASSGGTNGNATNSGLMQPQPVFPYPQHAIFGGAGNPGMYGAQAISGAASGGANVGGPPPGGLISITPQGATGASGPMAANQAQLQGGNAPPYLHPNATGHMYPQSLSQSLYPAHVRMTLPHGTAVIDGNNSSANVPFVGHAIAATGPGGGPVVGNSGNSMTQGAPMFQHGNPGAAGHAHHVATMQGGPTTNIQPALVAAAVAAGNPASGSQQNPNTAAAAAFQQQQQQNQLIQQEYANSYPPLPSLSANSESIGRSAALGETIGHSMGGASNVDIIAQQEMHPPMVSSPYYHTQIHQSENGAISVNSHSEFPTLQHHGRGFAEGQMIPGVHLQQQVENESLRNSFNRGVSGSALAGQPNINEASRQIARSERRESEGSGLSVEMQSVSHNHPSHNVNPGGNQMVTSQQQQQNNPQQSQQQQQQQQQQALTAVMAASGAPPPSQHLIHAAPNQQPHLAPRPGLPPTQHQMNLVYIQGQNMAAAVAQQQAHLAGMQQQMHQQHRNSISGPSGHDFHRSNSQEVNAGNGGGK